MARGQWFKKRKDRLERRLLTILLRRHRGNITKIAAAIDERRSRLYRMFERHGLNLEDYRQ